MADGRNDDPASQEKLWSMGAVCRHTGISEYTLRAWESRFGFPDPVRLSSGHRRYPVDQVRRLSSIQAALVRGHRIGDVVHLDEALIAALLTPASPAESAGSSHDLSGYLELCRRLDTESLALRLRSDAAALGIARFLAERVAPIVAGIGEAWQKGKLSIRHEHAATEIIDGVLRELRTPLERGVSGRPVLLGTLPDEQHTLGLQIVGLMIVSRGVPVRILGGASPVAELVESAAAFRASAVALSMTAAGITPATGRQITRLRERIPARTGLWLGGGGASLLRKLPDGVRVATSLDDVDALVAELRS